MRKLSLFFGVLSLSALAAHFQPYEGAPPAFSLTPEQQAQVAAGKLVFLLNDTEGEVKTGSVAFRVNAPESAIWQVLSDFSKYSEWSYKVKSASANMTANGLQVDF